MSNESLKGLSDGCIKFIAWRIYEFPAFFVENMESKKASVRHFHLFDLFMLPLLLRILIKPLKTQNFYLDRNT